MIYEIKDFKLDNDSLLHYETVFHNANGYIGVRFGFEEGYKEGFESIRGLYINGFYDIAEMKQAEKLFGMPEQKQTMLNIADIQGIKLYIDGKMFNMYEGSVESSKIWVDMSLGITGRSVVWSSPNGKKVEITIKRMTSFKQLSLFTIDYTVKALNFSGNIIFETSHTGRVENYVNPNDPRVAGESFTHLLTHKPEIIGGASYITADTVNSGLSVCSGVKNILSKIYEEEVIIGSTDVLNIIKTDIGHHEEVRLIKYTVLSDSIRCEDCMKNAVNEMKNALEHPLEWFYEEQREYLNVYSSYGLEIDGDDDLAAAVKYNLYQLIQSVGKDRYSNIAAKGLSGEGYEGHYFWDTEMYIQPFFVLTNAEISKNLIEYRYSILDKAKKHAEVMGHRKGALYPWRTIMGDECSGYFPSGSAQYHINGDIAYSITAYYLATNDLEFIREKGAEIIFETARLWIDAGNYYKGKFCINEVTGPDEYTCLVNNNYYTNAGAKYNLYWAAEFYRLLGDNNPAAEKIGLDEAEAAEFARAAENMFLPYDEEMKINPQDDTFLSKPVWNIAETPPEKFPLLLHYHPLYLYRHQVCKQADTVLAHFIYEDEQNIETIENSFKYYEKITTHDSSLSRCIFSIVASKLGQREKAFDYFGDSAKLDLFNTHGNTRDGIHTANMGGTYMAVVYGFAGLRLKKDGLFIAPYLPARWNSYSFVINYRGSRISVKVLKGECTVSLVSGVPAELYLYNKKYSLVNTIRIKDETI